MNAVIMAGGKGTRLHPLTAAMPKPLVNFFDRPVLEHQIELLKREGIDDIIITVGHLKHKIITRLGDGRQFGVRIRYVCEDVPLGTAGGVKLAESMLSETFVVISGDAITDVRLRDAIACHETNQAAATLVLKEVDDPSQYGIAEIDDGGRIMRFLEKPSADQVFSRTANTGMYVMERDCLRDVPVNEPYDFSKNLFPALMRAKRPLFGYRMNGYWNDVGSLTEYLEAHIHALEGHVKMPLIPCDRSVPDSATIHPRATVHAQSFIGAGVYLDDSAVVGENAVVGPNARIGASAQLKYCVIGEGSIIGEHAIVEDCVLSPGTVFPPYACIRRNVISLPTLREAKLEIYDRLDGPVRSLVESTS